MCSSSKLDRSDTVAFLNKNDLSNHDLTPCLQVLLSRDVCLTKPKPSILNVYIHFTYVQPPPGHASSHGRTTTSAAIEASVLLAPRLEQFTAAPATRHELCAFQASTENVSIRELVKNGAL